MHVAVLQGNNIGIKGILANVEEPTITTLLNTKANIAFGASVAPFTPKELAVTLKGMFTTKMTWGPTGFIASAWHKKVDEERKAREEAIVRAQKVLQEEETRTKDPRAAKGIDKAVLASYDMLRTIRNEPDLAQVYTEMVNIFENT